MATRSLIARRKNGLFEVIYCHFNGYPEYVGKILTTYYTDPEKIDKLFEHGALSILAPEIGEKNDFNNPKEDICLFYHRDCGDDWKDCKPKLVTNPMDLNYGQKYIYVWIDNKWECYEARTGNRILMIRK